MLSGKRQKKKTWTDYFAYAILVSPNTMLSYTSKSPRQIDVSINFYS